MIVYVAMTIVSIFFAFLSTNNKGLSKRIFQILSAVPFIVVSGIRYNVGTDYLYRYVPDYLIIYEGWNVPNLELVVKIIMKFCTMITSDYILFFMITSLLINGLMFWVIYKYSDKPLLSIVIYMINSSFFLSMNLIRQYISATLLMIAFLGFLKDNKKIKLIALVIVATFFHTSSIFFLPILLLKNKKLNNWLLVVFSIIILLFGNTLVEYILKLFSIFGNYNFSKYSIYLGQSGNIPFSSLIVELAIYVYICYCYNKLKFSSNEDYKKITFLLNMQWLAVLFTIACYTNELFIRISSMLTCFQIISLPYVYGILKKSCKLVDSYRCNKLLFIILLILMCARIVFSIIIKGSINVLPYKTIFDRPSDIYSNMNYIEYRYNRTKW